MNQNEFIQLMRYPKEWLLWDMLPEKVLSVQLAEYEPGSERASEHYRNGAFHFWLQQKPSKEILIKLARLSFLDPDPLMAEWVRNDYIAKAENTDEEVLSILRRSGI